MALTAAFIGCGGMGRSHLRRLLQSGRLQITGISDSRQESLEAAAELFREVAPEQLEGVEFSLDAKAMATEFAAEVGIVALPNYLHAEYTCAALEAGKHVFCEKPMALTEADTQAMLEARDRSGRTLMIGQSVRFFEASRVLKKAVREKTYGEILHGHFARIGGMAGPVPAERAWFVTQSLSGGAVMDLHIHDADLIVHLLGRPSAVQAFGAINHLRPDSGPDHMYMRYFFGEDRPFITAEAGWMRLPGTRFDGAFEVDFDRAMLLNLEGKLMLYRGEEKGGPAEVVEEFPADLPGDIWEYFVGRLEAGEQPTWCPPEDSAFAVKMANAVVAAVKSGEVVPLS